MGKNKKRHAEIESPSNKPRKSTDDLHQKKRRVCEEVSLASEGVENDVKQSREQERKLNKERKKEEQKQMRRDAVCTKLLNNTSVVSLASKGMKKMAELVAEEELTTEERRMLERKLKKERKKEERKRLLVEGLCTEASHVSTGASRASKVVKNVVNQETEEELTPEERRILERKLKKQRKKEEKKLMREGCVNLKRAEPEKLSGCDLALQYLTSWAQKAQDWKFQKTRQTWLLLHMYDTQRITTDNFTILLDYLEGLKGSARDLTVCKAESLLKEKEKADSEDISVLEVTERARQVIQLLS